MLSKSYRFDAVQRRRLGEELRRRGLEASRQEIRPRPDGTSYPLSSGQRRLWFLDQLDPGSSAYLMPAALRLAGALDLAVLARAGAEVVRRHQTLRAAFPARGGEPCQRLSPAPAALALPVVDLSALGAAAREHEAARQLRREAARPFDLAAGPPLRAAMFRLAPRDHVLLLALHHIAADGRSSEIFLEELGILYGAFSRRLPSPLAELPIQYADFAAWQSRQLAEGAFAPHLAYWRERLTGAAASLDLPRDRPAGTAARRGGRAAVPIRPAVLAAAKLLGRARQATPFMVLLAVFLAQLRRYTGRRDLAVGIPAGGRDRRETAGLIGFFINTLVLRVELPADPTFGELLAGVRAAALGAFAHQDLPFERLVEELRPERRLDRTPLFEVMFATSGPLAATLPGLAALPLRLPAGEPKFDLLLAAEFDGDRLAAELEYDAGQFDDTTARRLLAHYRQLLEAVLADVGRPLSEIEMLTPAERQQVLMEWNDTAVPAAAEAPAHAG